MRRIVVTLCAGLAVWLFATSASAQAPAQPTPPLKVAPGDEIKLDESSALKAAATQSRMQAILANVALLQRQFQDLQQEWKKSLDEHKKLVEDAGRKARVDVREPTEWVYDDAGHRYIRAAKKP